MTRVVIRNFARDADPVGTSVSQKRVRDACSGRFLIVRTIDGQSRTLGQDLDYVFGKNVAKARRDNKAATGVSDRAPSQG